jgi:hypothetical protein
MDCKIDCTEYRFVMLQIKRCIESIIFVVLILNILFSAAELQFYCNAFETFLKLYVPCTMFYESNCTVN